MFPCSEKKTTTVQDTDWSTPWFSFDGKCLIRGYLDNRKVRECLNALDYVLPIGKMPKEQAFAGLMKPLLDNFSTQELEKHLSPERFLKFLKKFYKYPYKTGYSRAFGI